MRVSAIIIVLALALPASALYWEDDSQLNEYQLRLEDIYGWKGYPPGVPDDPPVDHTYDVLHYNIELDIDTVNEDFDQAVVTIYLEFTQNGVNSVGLQLTDNMTVSEVRKFGGSVFPGYTHDNDILDITLDATYNMGDEISIQVTYSGAPMAFSSRATALYTPSPGLHTRTIGSPATTPPGIKPTTAAKSR